MGQGFAQIIGQLLLPVFMLMVLVSLLGGSPADVLNPVLRLVTAIVGAVIGAITDIVKELIHALSGKTTKREPAPRARFEDR